MNYRKLTADKIFDGTHFHEGKALVLDDDGSVHGLVPLEEAGGGVERFGGILSPGFINCHCHVELSHFKGAIPAKTGLVGFLTSIVKNRASFTGDKEPAIHAADLEMYESGIDGVGDICNTTDALPIKQGSRMRWHSFVEVINFYDQNMERQVGWPQTIVHQHEAAGLSAALVPHAPYSVSGKTMEVINERTEGRIISIHNQETAPEDELFKSGTGDFIGFYKEFGNPASPFPVSGRSSLQTWLPRFTNGQTILVVHNTFIGEEDIVFAKEHAQRYGLKIVYCLCPNANLYIEDRLPPAELFEKHGCTVVLGTDSYSSNWQLSIAAEMKALKDGKPALSLETLLKWATSNGAEAMRWNELGSFGKGKKPGIVLIDSEDISKSKRL
jgi:cytosine/adenosine deaminase-related metal-dependent hydrolase